MEVEVTVKAEDLDIREAVLTGTALVTIVALEQESQLKSIP